MDPREFRHEISVIQLHSRVNKRKDLLQILIYSLQLRYQAARILSSFFGFKENDVVPLFGVCVLRPTVSKSWLFKEETTRGPGSRLHTPAPRYINIYLDWESLPRATWLWFVFLRERTFSRRSSIDPYAKRSESLCSTTRASLSGWVCCMTSSWR